MFNSKKIKKLENELTQVKEDLKHLKGCLNFTDRQTSYLQKCINSLANHLNLEINSGLFPVIKKEKK